MLKAQTGWNAYSGSTNEDVYGFAALPAGYYDNGDYNYVGNGAVFWRATQYDMYNAYYMMLYWHHDYAVLYSIGYKNDYGLSVRCLKDTVE